MRYINFDVGTAVVTGECYAMITQSGPNAGYIWNDSGSAWTLYNEANYNVYPVAISELGGSGMCQLPVPPEIDIPGEVYGVSIRRKPTLGAVPAPTDETLLQFEYRIQSAIDANANVIQVETS